MKVNAGKERGWYEKEESFSNGDRYTSSYCYSSNWIFVFPWEFEN